MKEYLSNIDVWQAPKYSSECYSSNKYSLGRGLSEVKTPVLEVITLKNKHHETVIKL